MAPAPPALCAPYKLPPVPGDPKISPVPPGWGPWRGSSTLPVVPSMDPQFLPGSEGHGPVSGAHPAVGAAAHHRVGHRRGSWGHRERVGE